MRKIILTAAILFLQFTIFGQKGNPIIINFESDTNYKHYVYIDSSDVDNIWQIGNPNKTVFDSAYSIPNALVTDTVNTYPVNNISSFFLLHVVDPWEKLIILSYSYKLNSDTLADFAKIECSVNHGLTWIDLSAPSDTFYQWEIIPIYSGNSNGWKLATSQFNAVRLNLNGGDTLLFKFTFISDNIETYKDGWIIDDLFVEDVIDIGIKENLIDENIFKVFYKGDGKVELIIQRYEYICNYKMQFFELSGKCMGSFNIANKKNNVFQLPNIKNGIYFYRISMGNKVKQNGKICIIN